MPTFIVTFRGPAMEARDLRAGEKPYDEYPVEVEASSHDHAQAIGEKMAEEAGEGAAVVDVELCPSEGSSLAG